MGAPAHFGALVGLQGPVGATTELLVEHFERLCCPLAIRPWWSLCDTREAIWKGKNVFFKVFCFRSEAFWGTFLGPNLVLLEAYLGILGPSWAPLGSF